MSSELWLGLDTISRLTKTGNWELRVDLVDFEGVNYTAFYTHFKIEEEPLYRLRISGFDEEISTVRDCLIGKNGMAFSTSDNDNDVSTANCAKLYLGAWWYSECVCANLNGFNYNDGSLPETPEFYAKGITWAVEKGHYFSWPQVTMKMKRKL